MSMVCNRNATVKTKHSRRHALLLTRFARLVREAEATAREILNLPYHAHSMPDRLLPIDGEDAAPVRDMFPHVLSEMHFARHTLSVLGERLCDLIEQDDTLRAVNEE